MDGQKISLQTFALYFSTVFSSEKCPGVVFLGQKKLHVFLFMSSPNSPPYPPSVFPEVRDLSYWITLCVLLPLYYLMIFWWQTGMMDNLKVSVLIVCVYKFCCLICVKDIHHWSIINSWSVKSVKRKTYKGMKESCWGRNQYDNTTYNINKRFF